MKYLKAGIEGVTATVVNTGAILSRAMGTMASGKQGHSLLDRADVGSGGHKLGAASRFAQKAAAVARASKAVGRAFAIEHGAPGMVRLMFTRQKDTKVVPGRELLSRRVLRSCSWLIATRSSLSFTFFSPCLEVGRVKEANNHRPLSLRKAHNTVK